jgi:1-deoxy-D-xylulose-5-phosphate synthase
VDRADVVGADGVTHQGVYDVAMMRAIPNLVICQPRDAEDFEALFDEALQRNGPTLIRYPRGTAPERIDPAPERGDAKLCIVAAGDQYVKACALGDMFSAEVIHARYLKPFDSSGIKARKAAGVKIATIENGSAIGGLGEMLGADFKFGWPDEPIVHGDIPSLEKAYGLDVDSIAERLKKAGFTMTAKEVLNG